MRRRKRKCRHCGEFFKPSPYNAHKQVYCGKSECRAESGRASSRKHRAKVRNDEEWREREKERVREWRASNPDYWKRGKVEKKSESPSALRDFAQLENGAEDFALRDVVFWQKACFEGLVRFLTGALRDDIGAQMNRFYDMGAAASGGDENRCQPGGS